jgi:succinate dehydrogenase (ubiquinone) cytochrome b560 subunit
LGASARAHAGHPCAPHTHANRWLGGDRIPQYWGKPSPYTEGTAFLGTPTNHEELIKKRPLSPDVFEPGSIEPHYKMPWGAISSITNRATGAMLSAGA